MRTLEGLPPIRRDLIQRYRYLVPNSIVVSRGCPQHCTFCYKDAFFAGGRSFYTQLVDDALAEIALLPGRHLYFPDDHLFGNPRFARDLFHGMKGMGRVFQAAATVDSILRDDLIEVAASAGLRSLFVGFETLSSSGLEGAGKRQNLGRSYGEVVRRLDSLGIMIRCDLFSKRFSRRWPARQQMALRKGCPTSQWSRRALRLAHPGLQRHPDRQRRAGRAAFFSWLPQSRFSGLSAAKIWLSLTFDTAGEAGCKLLCTYYL